MKYKKRGAGAVLLGGGETLTPPYLTGVKTLYMDSAVSILEVLQSDYDRFPHDQTYEIYAENVYFKDPITQFRGRDRYRQMISFIRTWFRQPQLDLHHMQRSGNQIRTDWTLSWTTPLPWQRRIAIDGWSELKLNDQELIVSHIDYWHCSVWDVVKQHLPIKQ